VELLLLKYGYLLMFVGIIFEGEAVLIAGSFLASRGYFNISTVALVALAANCGLVLTVGHQERFVFARSGLLDYDDAPLSVECVRAGVECAEYAPARVKQTVCGYGRAEKAQVQRMVMAILGLKQPPTPHHAADALAVAICHALAPPLLKIA